LLRIIRGWGSKDKKLKEEIDALTALALNYGAKVVDLEVISTVFSSRFMMKPTPGLIELIAFGRTLVRKDLEAKTKERPPNLSNHNGNYFEWVLTHETARSSPFYRCIILWLLSLTDNLLTPKGSSFPTLCTTFFTLEYPTENDDPSSQRKKVSASSSSNDQVQTQNFPPKVNSSKALIMKQKLFETYKKQKACVLRSLTLWKALWAKILLCLAPQPQNAEVIQWLITIHLEAVCRSTERGALFCLSSYGAVCDSYPEPISRAFLACCLQIAHRYSSHLSMFLLLLSLHISTYSLRPSLKIKKFRSITLEQFFNPFFL
jgi:hypothetical protein